MNFVLFKWHFLGFPKHNVFFLVYWKKLWIYQLIAPGRPVFFNLLRFKAPFKGFKKFGGTLTCQKWQSEAPLAVKHVIKRQILCIVNVIPKFEGTLAPWLLFTAPLCTLVGNHCGRHMFTRIIRELNLTDVYSKFWLTVHIKFCKKLAV